MISRIVIHGAGSIGCFVGGVLSRAVPVTLLGRERMGTKLRSRGLRLTSYDGLDLTLAPQELAFETSPAVLSTADCILVCVKSGQTDSAARELAGHVRPGTLVVSLQNGVRNAETLREKIGARAQVLAGMVPFNVAETSDAHFHRGTSGALFIEDSDAAKELVALAHRAGLPARTHSDMTGVLWGKLLLNLNNPINALSGLALKDELSRRGYRRILADCIEEALPVLKAAGIHPRPPIPIPVRFLPTLLRLPDPVFRRLARKMIAIDPQARSSMWDDLRLGRKTEIDWISGEIITLGRRHSIPTPRNSRVIEMIRQCEQQGAPGSGTEPSAFGF